MYVNVETLKHYYNAKTYLPVTFAFNYIVVAQN